MLNILTDLKEAGEIAKNLAQGVREKKLDYEQHINLLCRYQGHKFDCQNSSKFIVLITH